MSNVLESMEKCVEVCEREGEEFVKIPLESDGTLSMDTLRDHFPGVTGLKFRLNSSSPCKTLRLSGGRLHAPGISWAENKFYCVYPKGIKRKYKKNMSVPSQSHSNTTCADLIVLGLPYSLLETELHKYFERFGKLVMFEIKRDAFGNSKGFGFIRYKHYSSQVKALRERHSIKGRWVEVKIPYSSMECSFSDIPHIPHKIFVGCLTKDIREHDLRRYFSQYGEVIDVYIPKPFKAYGFVTFNNDSIARSLCDENHIVKGVAVRICKAHVRSGRRLNKQVGSQQYMSRNTYMAHIMLAAALQFVYQRQVGILKKQDWKHQGNFNLLFLE